MIVCLKYISCLTLTCARDIYRLYLQIYRLFFYIVCVKKKEIEYIYLLNKSYFVNIAFPVLCSVLR